MDRTLASLALVLAAGCGANASGTDTGHWAGPSPTVPDAASPPAPSSGAPPPATDASAPPAPADAAAPSPADAAPPPSPPSCPTPAWTPGTESTIDLPAGGQTRQYVVHVGSAVPVGVAVPLLVNVHGLNNSPQIQELFSGMNAIADQKGFVVVYPQGLMASFNAGGCCGYAQQNGVDDLGFVRALVADVEKKTCIDARRVYATGFSNGGYMAHTLGCLAADLFAAIAPVSGGNAATSCAPGRAVPVIDFHGDADPIVAYSTGQSAVSDWVVRDGCGGGSTRTTYGSSHCDEWTGCDAGAKVRFCTIAGGSHLWPGAGAAIEASPMIWDFLSQFTLPEVARTAR